MERYEGLNRPGGNNKFPASFWYFLTVVAIITGVLLFKYTHSGSGSNEQVIKDSTAIVQKKQSDIIEKAKSSSLKAKEKGDSLINILNTQPWRLEEKDLKDSIVVEYLKNYHKKP